MNDMKEFLNKQKVLHISMGIHFATIGMEDIPSREIQVIDVEKLGMFFWKEIINYKSIRDKIKEFDSYILDCKKYDLKMINEKEYFEEHIIYFNQMVKRLYKYCVACLGEEKVKELIKGVEAK